MASVASCHSWVFPSALPLAHQWWILPTWSHFVCEKTMNHKEKPKAIRNSFPLTFAKVGFFPQNKAWASLLTHSNDYVGCSGFCCVFFFFFHRPRVSKEAEENTLLHEQFVMLPWKSHCAGSAWIGCSSRAPWRRLPPATHIHLSALLLMSPLPSHCLGPQQAEAWSQCLPSRGLLRNCMSKALFA